MKFQVKRKVLQTLFVLILKYALINGKLSAVTYVNTGTATLIRSISGIALKILRPGEAILMVDPVESDFRPPRSFGKQMRPNVTNFHIKSDKDLGSFSLFGRSLINFSVYHTYCPRQLNRILKKMKYYSVNDPDKNAIIVDLSPDTQDVLPKFFEVIWKNGFVRTIVLKLRLGSTEIVDIYHWDPLEPIANCGRNTSTYTKIGFYSIRNDSYSFFNTKFELFSLQSRNTASNCTLRVGAVVYPPFVFEQENADANSDGPNLRRGFEVNLVRVIAENLGLNITFKMSELPLNWGYLEENGSATGIFKDLLNEKVDMGISSFTYISRPRYIEFGPPYAYEHMVWCVPQPLQVEPWTRLLYPYGRTYWILYCIVLILSSLVMWLLSSFQENEPKYNRRLDNCFFRSLADVYGNTYTMHRPKSTCIKLFQVVWLFFTLHMSVLYSGKLFSLLTINLEDSHFHTQEDVLNSKLRLQIMSSTKHFLVGSETSSDVRRRILHKYTTCGNILDCLERVAVTKDSAVCLTGSMVQFLNAYHLPINCIRNAVLISFPITIVLRKHYYFTGEIRTKVFWLFEAGLIHLWRRQAIQFHSRQYLAKNPLQDCRVDSKPTRGRTTITFKNLRSAFLILCYGYILAAIVLIIELFKYHLTIYRNYIWNAEAGNIIN